MLVFHMQVRAGSLP